MKELLKKLHACKEAREWAGDKTWEEIYTTCHRGDWLLWLFARANPEDKLQLILAAAHCVNTVRNLMRDERSRKAIDIAIRYGEGNATDGELADATYAASEADEASAADAADASAYAAYAASAADAAYAAADAAADAAAYAADAAKKKNQKLTADIVRKYLPIEIWNIERGEK